MHVDQVLCITVRSTLASRFGLLLPEFFQTQFDLEWNVSELVSNVNRKPTSKRSMRMPGCLFEPEPYIITPASPSPEKARNEPRIVAEANLANDLEDL